jgi:hypothetical protein
VTERTSRTGIDSYHEGIISIPLKGAWQDEKEAMVICGWLHGGEFISLVPGADIDR